MRTAEIKEWDVVTIYSVIVDCPYCNKEQEASRYEVMPTEHRCINPDCNKKFKINELK